MSDMSQGPGWWIASDGKWYPPHLHPDVRVRQPWEADDGHVAADSQPPSGSGPSGPATEPVSRFIGADALAGTAVAGPGPDPATAPPVGHRKRASKTPLVSVVGVVVVILLVVGAVIVFGNTKSASAQVVDAVNNTLGNGTAHVTMSISGKTDGTSVSGTGSGSIDFTHDALQLQMTIGADGQQVPLDAIYLDGVIYESIPGLSTVAPGKSWLSLDLSSLQKAEEQDPSTSGLGSNPTVMLQMLAQQGNTVIPLGPSTVDGVAVNGYSVTVNPSAVTRQLKKENLPAWLQQAASGLKVGKLDLKVYVDGAGMLQSFQTQLTETSGTAGTVSFEETLGFSDYGAPVTVTAPPAGQVETFQQLLQVAGTQGAPTS